MIWKRGKKGEKGGTKGKERGEGGKGVEFKGVREWERKRKLRGETESRRNKDATRNGSGLRAGEDCNLLVERMYGVWCV